MILRSDDVWLAVVVTPVPGTHGAFLTNAARVLAPSRGKHLEGILEAVRTFVASYPEHEMTAPFAELLQAEERIARQVVGDELVDLRAALRRQDQE